MYNIGSECIQGNIYFGDSCEHCGNIEPKSIIWCDGGTWWCLDCARFMYGFNLTPEEIKRLKIVSKTKKILYYKNKIKEIEDND